MMTFGSLFAGIGGCDLGLERAGMECRWQVEIDDYATKVLERHWPQVRRYRDVRECGAHNLEPVDLICGGFPCQPFSLAGKRNGNQDSRYLWPEFARIIRELRPAWILAENVPGLLSINDGWEFGKILRDLAESGYDAEWDCIPASAIGAPHRRDRVWIVAYTNNTRLEGYRLFGKCTGKFPTWQGIQKQDWAQFITRDIRVVDGIPARVDRLQCLGNAVVPQVVEWIGKRLIEYGLN